MPPISPGVAQANTSSPLPLFPGPTLTTIPSPTAVTLATNSVTLTDSATLANGKAPTGTITFSLVAPGGGTVDTETVAVSGNGTYSTPTGFHPASDRNRDRHLPVERKLQRRRQQPRSQRQQRIPRSG